MSESTIKRLFSTFKVSSEVFHNGQYCGNWSIDTSGKQYLSFHLVTHGECFLMVNDDRSDIKHIQKGDLILFPHDAIHQLSSDRQFLAEVNATQSKSINSELDDLSTGLVCGYFCHQHPLVKQMTEFLPESIIISVNKNTPSAISTILQLLIEESLNSEDGASFILEKLSECVLALLFREHLDLDKGVIAALSHEKLNQSVSAIINEPEASWSLDSLAKLSNMSRSSFSELFKTVVGTSVMEYVAQWRISVAYRLLKDKSNTTLAVAQQVGYESESSFSKAFKRILGVSPGAVRNEK